MGADPAAVAERRESVALAFITALQRLPARQRAALILRDVLAWNAAEVAALLELSVPAVNSALQRARATLSATQPADSLTAHPRLDDHQRQILNRFTDAWRRCDIEALAALLREDVILSMPPELATITGRAQVSRFFATVPAGGRLDTIRLVRTSANGHPALAAYLPDQSARCHGYGIMVFTITGDGIATITGFPSPDLFERFDLPQPARDSGEDSRPGAGELSAGRSSAARPCEGLALILRPGPDDTVFEVVVDQAHGLHERVHRGGVDELPALLLEGLGERG